MGKIPDDQPNISKMQVQIVHALLGRGLLQR